MAAASNFRALEATNRRETAILVLVFIVLFAALGFGLDIAARNLYFDNGWSADPAVYRLRVADQKVEQVASITLGDAPAQCCL
jgi:hypothetical protein